VRIALTHAFCWPEVRRGGERLAAELSAALARRGHEVVLFSASRRPGRHTRDGVEVVCLRRIFDGQYRHEAHFGLRVLPLLAAHRFDAVHSLGRHDALASIRAARARGDGRRTVFTDLGLPDRRWWREQGRHQARVMAAVVRDIDVYGAMSRAALDRLADGYGRTDGVIVPGGVATDVFAPAPAREPRPTILYSGALGEPRKGVAVLLAALPLIADAEPEVRLWLSGPGDAAPLLTAAPEPARHRVRVLGVGAPDRQPARYGRAWVTCLPSTHDSFGLALLESLACATPVVTTTDSAPQELVEPGVTGELCRAGDPEALAAACLRALALSRRPDTGDRCRAAMVPYDWDAAVAPLCEGLYRGGGARRG
jgi:glycosyltransferase involved in cell wall biosynthesis